MMEVKNKTKATTNCSICRKMYIDPKILPCFHTFCVKCIETIATKANKKPGDHLECPCCEKTFSIPHEGFAKLQKHFFIEKLVTLTNILKTKGEYCNECREEGESSSPATQASPVTSYCFSCSLPLCVDCYKHHKRSRLTKSHKMLVIDNQAITAERMEMLASAKCEQHKDEELKIYCIDCKISTCLLCYIDSHQTHNRSDIKIAAQGHRKQLFEDIGVAYTCVNTVQRQNRELENSQRKIEDKIRAMRNQVEKRRSELKKLVDVHANVFIGQLDSLRKAKLNEIENAREDINRNINCLESFKSYVTEFAEIADAIDICQDVNSLNERLTELKTINENITQHQLSPLTVSFWKSDFSSCRNILGTIQDKDSGTKETTKSEPSEEVKDLLNKIEQLERETETEKSNSHRHQETINILNQMLLTEISIKDNSLIKEKQLSDEVKQLEQEVTLLKRKAMGVETVLEDTRKERNTLDSEIKKYVQKESEFIKERSVFASKESEFIQERSAFAFKESEFIKERSAVATKESEFIKERSAFAFKESEFIQERSAFASKESEFIQERSAFASKERQLSEQVQQLTFQEIELNKAIDKLKEEAALEHRTGNTLKGKVYELQKQLVVLRLELNTLKEKQHGDRHEKEAQLDEVTLRLDQTLSELEADRNKLRNLEEERVKYDLTLTSVRQKSRELGMLLFKRRPETRDYEGVHASVQKLVCYPLQERAITGLTIICNILYVTRKLSRIIIGYDLTTFVAKLEFPVTGLSNPSDVKGRGHNDLCIFDMKSHDERKEIIIFDLSSKAIQRRWSTGDDYGSISVTDEGNVILTVRKKNKLKEYTLDGQVIREILLSPEIVKPLHSLKLISGHFLVSYSRKNGICIVDEDGDVLISFVEENVSWLGPTELVCLTVDSSGSIMAADKTAGRVLLLTPTLELKKELITQVHGLKSPVKIHLDESDGIRLLVADDGLKSGVHTCIFEFGSQYQPVTQTQVVMEGAVKIFSRLTPRLLTVCLVILSSQTFAYYGWCGNTYCFTTPDLNDSSQVSLDSARSTCRGYENMLLEIDSPHVQSNVTQFIEHAIGDNKLLRNPILLNAQKIQSDRYYWVNGLAIASGVDIREDHTNSAMFGCMCPTNHRIGICTRSPTVLLFYLCEASSSRLGCSFQFYSRCYITVFRLETWFDARMACIKDWKGDLASFDNIIDNPGLRNLDGFLGSLEANFWIGLRKMWWVWANSVFEVTYTNWKKGHPSNFTVECICLSPETSEWLWVECGCESSLGRQLICDSGPAPHQIAELSSACGFALDAILFATMIAVFFVYLLGIFVRSAF